MIVSLSFLRTKSCITNPQKRREISIEKCTLIHSIVSCKRQNLGTVWKYSRTFLGYEINIYLHKESRWISAGSLDISFIYKEIKNRMKITLLGSVWISGMWSCHYLLYLHADYYLRRYSNNISDVFLSGLKESVYIRGNEDFISKPSVEINTIWEPFRKK